MVAMQRVEVAEKENAAVGMAAVVGMVGSGVVAVGVVGSEEVGMGAGRELRPAAMELGAAVATTPWRWPTSRALDSSYEYYPRGRGASSLALPACSLRYSTGTSW